MPLLPFGSQTCKVLTHNQEEVRLHTNSGMSPAWILLSVILLLQPYVTPWPLILIFGALSVCSTNIVLSKINGTLRLERRILAWPVWVDEFNLDDIRELKVAEVQEPEGQRTFRLTAIVNREHRNEIKIGLARRAMRDGLEPIRRPIQAYIDARKGS